MGDGPTLYVSGTGKTVDFHGVVILNCENGKAAWLAAGNFFQGAADPDRLADEVVPAEAMRRAHEVFCPPSR